MNGWVDMVADQSGTSVQGAGFSSMIFDIGGNVGYRTAGLCNGALVNAVQFLPSAGTITVGKIYMYGIKNT
jgi:hypothetical protein